jgi:hypothetical protein
MRTQKEQVRNFIKGMTFGLLVVMVMFTTAGCPSSDNNGNSNRNRDFFRNDYRYGGPGFGGFGGVGFVGMGTDTQQGTQIILEVAQENYNSGIGFGSGPAMVMGEMNVQMPIMCNMGGALEPGYYEIQPMGNNTAVAFGELLQYAQVVAFGRFGEAVLEINNGYFFRGRTGDYDGLQAQVTVVSVNGYPCGASFVVSDLNWL